VPRLHFARRDPLLVGVMSDISAVSNHDRLFKVRDLKLGMSLSSVVSEFDVRWGKFVVDKEEFGFGVIENVGYLRGLESGEKLLAFSPNAASSSTMDLVLIMQTTPPARATAK
jgi:hypothetical protein